jgi:hypothetical protein
VSLPLFGRKEKVRSVRDVPDWEKVMSLLSEKIGDEYEVAFSPLPLGIFGSSEFEVVRDKQRHTMIYPSSLNSGAPFYGHRYVKDSLDKLDVSLAPDGIGTQVVGRFDSFVSRKFVDGFIGCMSNVYGISWDRMHVWIHGKLHPRSLPVFLVGDPLAMIISPYIFSNLHLEPTGKYQPLSPGGAG